ncbi:MAG: hypothetical protein NZ920_01200 [Aigarchaeota archaeon]|nr:hypothetical protein [Aigarchaeota archaeon]MDW8093057.1 hypothetical protein [Nitrososphaerota archaeon]
MTAVELRPLISKLFEIAVRHAEALDRLEVGSKEAASVTSSLCKLLNALGKYHGLLSEEEKDLALMLSKTRRTTKKHHDAVSSAREHLEIALRELDEI